MAGSASGITDQMYRDTGPQRDNGMRPMPMPAIPRGGNMPSFGEFKSQLGHSVSNGAIGGQPNNSMMMDLKGQMMPRGGSQPQQPQYDVNTAAAQGLQRAQQGAASEMNYRPMAVNSGGYRPSEVNATGYTAAGVGSQGYNAAQAGSRGYNAAQARSRGYDAAGVGSQGYNAAQAGSQGYDAAKVTSRDYTAAQTGQAPTLSANQVTGGQIAGTDLQSYMNPYEDQVVQQSLSDIERSRLMQQNVGGAQAGAANAFGGSRQGIAEAETNRAFADQAARTASGLRQSGYQNAQQMAGQDIGTRMQASLANQGANLQAGTTSAQMAQQRALQNQSALNQAGQFGANASNQAAAQASQQQQAASQFGASSANQSALQNQAAINQASQFGAGASNQAASQASQQQQAASQFGAGASNQAALQNQASRNQASQFGAGASNQAALQNQAALNQAGQFGAGASNQAAMQSQAALNQARQYGAGATNQASLANQSAFNQAGQFGSSQNMQAQLANQAAGLSGSQQRLNAGSQLGNLSNLGFGMGQTIQGNMNQQGAQQQALQQQLINAAKQQYAGYTGAPSQSLQYLLQAVGGAPAVGSQSESYSPGLFDYLSLGARF